MGIEINVTTGETTTIDDNPNAEQERLEQAWKLFRARRNSVLAACDWTVLSDTPTTTTAWKTYRQALRDLPANTTDPSNPVWPTPPS